MNELVVLKGNELFTDNIENIRELSVHHPDTGFVYVILIDHNKIKIGQTKTPIGINV